MKENKIVLFSLKYLFLVIVLLGNVSAAFSATYIVYLPSESPCTTSTPNEPAYYKTTIQSAVDASGGGDTVKVCPGTYYENVHAYKSKYTCDITIESYSQNPTDTIVKAVDPDQNTFYLGCMGAPWENDGSPSVIGFTITGATGGPPCNNAVPSENNPSSWNYAPQSCAGIRVYCSTYGKGGSLRNNIITGNNIGINIKDTDPTWEFFYVVEDNTITSNKSVGINRHFGWGNTIFNNYISDNPIGIRTIYADDDIFEGNTIISNGVGIEGNNYFYYNRIIGNAVQAPDTCNLYNHDTLEGNYWSDYSGDDDGSGTDKHSIAGDNIGDTLIPHPSGTCSGDSDEYPFMYSDAWVCSNLPVTIAAAPFYTLQDAYDTAVNGDTIQSRSIILPKDLNIDRNISITLNGGFACDYSSNANITTVYGNMMISDGSVAIQSGIIEIL